MRRTADSFDSYGYEPRYSEDVPIVTIRGLFEAIDSYNKKDHDIKTAIKKIDRILTERPELIYASDETGNTGLIHACSKRLHPRFRGVWLGPDYEIVNTLLHYGADPNARNNAGKTALHFACEFEPRCSKIQGMRDTFKSNDEDKKYMLRVARKLIKAGGDLRLHDIQNRRPIDYTRRSTASNKFRTEMLTFLGNQQDQFTRFLETRISQNSERYRNFKLTEKKPNNASLRGWMGREIDFSLEQPRLKFTGYGNIIDHVGGKLSAFGEAATIPYVSSQTIFDQKGEQKLRLRILNFTLSRRVWKGTNVSYLCLEDAALDEDKLGTQNCYKIDRYDLLNSEIQKNSWVRHPSILLMMAVTHDPTSRLVRGIIYERVDLGTLHYFCSIGQYLDSTEWIPLMQQITDATEFLHESDVIHQAICPQSIMFTNHRTAKLGMLCFSRSTRDVSYNRESTQIPDKFHRYIAPEVVNNELPIRESDVFSLCATLYQLMHGIEPWNGVKNHQIKRERRDIEIDADAEPSILQQAVRLGLQQSIKERKTRLKDISYHLANLRAYQRYGGSQNDLLSRSTLSNQNSIGSSTVGTKPRLDSVSRHSKSSTRSKVSRNDQHRTFRPPPGLPKRAMSLKEFEEVSSNRSFDVFLDVNQNKSIECYEQMEPLHLNYEENSDDGVSTNRSTVQPDPRVEQFLLQQLESTNDTTPTRVQARPKSATKKKGTPLFGTRSDSAVLEKKGSTHLVTAQSHLDACRNNVMRCEGAIDLLEGTDSRQGAGYGNGTGGIQEDGGDTVFLSANQSANETPQNIIPAPEPTRSSTTGQRNMKQMFSDTVGKVFGRVQSEEATYCRFHNVDTPPKAASNQSFAQQFPTPREFDQLPKGKNVTINSDLNEEYTISNNASNNDSFFTPAMARSKEEIPVTTSASAQNRALWGQDLMKRVDELAQTEPLNLDKLSQSSIEGSENNNCIHDDENFNGPLASRSFPLKPERFPQGGAITVARLEQQHNLLKPIPQHSVKDYGERRDSFDFQFKNTVDVEHVLNSRLDPNSPDFVDAALVDEKNNLRDIARIPKILVESPTPEKVHLRPTRSPSLPCPFQQAQNDGMFLKPTLSAVDELSSSMSTLDTRTPSRLSFNEKVAKFKTQIGEIDLAPPPKGSLPPPAALDVPIQPQSNPIPSHPTPIQPPCPIVTSTPAVGRASSREKYTNTASEIVSNTLEKAQEELQTERPSPTDIAQNIKDMIDQSAAEDLAVSDSQPNEIACKRDILLRSRQHQTFSQSFSQDIQYDPDTEGDVSVEHNAPSNVSLWEEGYDDEPIVGNEKVNVRYAEVDTPEIPELSSPGFNFDETHKISQCDTDIEDEPNSDNVNRLMTTPKDHYRLTPSLTPRRTKNT